MNLAVCNCEQYRQMLADKGVRGQHHHPGIDAAFNPKLVLGFVGRFSTYGFRKGADLLQQVNDLDFVKTCRH